METLNIDKEKMLALPARERIVEHVLKAMSAFAKAELSFLRNMPIQKQNIKLEKILRLQSVKIPNFNQSKLPFDSILVPEEFLTENTEWHELDWWTIAFVLLECWHERMWEIEFGSINSYSYKLKNWDHRVWDKPLVNDIFMFLIEWHNFILPSKAIKNVRLHNEIIFTFDLDAVTKSKTQFTKNFLFFLFKIIDSLIKLKTNHLSYYIKSLRKIFQRTNSNFMLEEFFFNLKHIPIQYKKIIFVYAKIEKKRKINFYDPRYSLDNTFLKKFLMQISKLQFEYGLHSSFYASQDKNLFSQEKDLLAKYFQEPVKKNRTHWLKFSWMESWKTMEDIGIVEDYTLMFNDRPGFRNSASFSWNPWSPLENRTMKIRATPTVLMDSHFYFYRPFDQESQMKLKYFLTTMTNSKGACAILWHPHSFHKSINWSDGFHMCLQYLKTENSVKNES